MKTLSASSAPNRPFLPAFRTGKNTSQAKAIETMGKGAQVSLPETAVLITAHAALPANSSRENATAHRLRIVPAAASASLSAYCRAFSLPAAGPSASVLLCSPFSNSWMVTPSMSATEGKREISGQLIPRSHFETALSVIFSMRAKSFCVICLSFLRSAINRPIFSVSMMQRLLIGIIILHGRGYYNRLLVECSEMTRKQAVSAWACCKSSAFLICVPICVRPLQNFLFRSALLKAASSNRSSKYPKRAVAG